MKLSVYAQAARLPFLILTPVCVFLGASLAYEQSKLFDLGLLFLITISAIFAHIIVNTLYVYFDFKSGLDLKSAKTPFSGGSGALPNNPEYLDKI